VEDLRDKILDSKANKRINASIIADDAGILVGTPEIKEEAERLGLSLERLLNEGSQVNEGDEIASFCGSPKQVAMAEDVLIGIIAKPSGIATSAHKAVEATGGKPKIVCGAWKKMPLVLRDIIRRAIITGGAQIRISVDPFVYLDKNYVEILGGIKESLKAVRDLKTFLKVVQIKGRYKDIVLEACEATEFGADILFIDTGRPSDVKAVVNKLVLLGLRKKVNIAFGGGITLESIDELKTMDIDILDIGRQIVDAPLLDMRMEIINSNGKQKNKSKGFCNG
jgi:nicotinate-nucleotide pyrophosphorylase (carboxylating)